MKTVGRFLFFLAIAGVLAATTSCKKIREDNLINGLWQLNSIYIDTAFSTNQLNDLPFFKDGDNCCKYQVDFQENKLLLGYYLTHDTFNYVTTGRWNMVDYNHIYIQLDNYLDGEFEMKRRDANLPVVFELFSQDNHIKAFEGSDPRPDTAFTAVEIERL